MASIAGPPKQQRSRDSLEKLLVAGLEILEERGFEGFTNAAVAERAGVGVAIVYRRFADQNSFMGALFERFSQKGMEDLGVGIQVLAEADIDLEEFVPRFTRLVASSFRDNATLMHAFITANRGDAVLAAAVARATQESGVQLKASLLSHRDEIVRPDAERAVDFCHKQMINAFVALVADSTPTAPPFGWDETIREVSEMTLAYLRSVPSAR